MRRLSSVIKSLAAKIVEEHPNYHLFTDNCQNFGQYLVKDICGQDALCPATIQKILERLFLGKDVPTFPKEILPGTYPPSFLAPIRPTHNSGVSQFFSPDSYYTATPHSYYTATPHSYISASSPKESDYTADIHILDSRQDETPFDHLDTHPLEQSELALPPQLQECISHLTSLLLGIESPLFLQYDIHFIYSVTRILGPLVEFERIKKSLEETSFDQGRDVYCSHLKLESRQSFCPLPVMKTYRDVRALFAEWQTVSPYWLLRLPLIEQTDSVWKCQELVKSIMGYLEIEYPRFPPIAVCAYIQGVSISGE